MAKKNKTENKTLPELEMRLGPAGLEYENNGVIHLFSWPDVLRRLGQADADLTLNIQWGNGLLDDQIDWVDLLTHEGAVEVVEHNVLADGKKNGVLKAVAEFEDDRIRLYYDDSCGGESGIVELRHAPGARFSLHQIAFRPFGSKTEIIAEAFWFSGSLAY